MRIATGIVTFADSLGLLRTLETLDGGIDQNIVIHAQYPGFHPPNASRSLDDTKIICQAFPNTTLLDLNIAPELEARQAYLNLASTYDFLLVLDSDEYLDCDSEQKDWGLFRQNCQKVIDAPPYIYDIAFENVHQPQPVRPRLFKHPSKIKYHLKHYWWLLPNGRLMKGNSDSVHWVQGIRILHDKELRDKEYVDATNRYQQSLLQQESQYVV